jgi:hypothetical protein
VVGEDSRPITGMTSARVLATFGPSAARLTGRPLRWEPHKPGDADVALSSGSCASSSTASDGDKRSTRQGMQPPVKQLLWNDREARERIPVVLATPNAEPTQEDGCLLTRGSACAARARARNPWIKWSRS